MIDFFSKILVLISLINVLNNAKAGLPENEKSKASNPSNLSSALSDCARATSRVDLDINNVRTLVHNGGDMWWTVVSPSQARYEIPKQDDPSAPKQHSLFAGSIWLGGVVEADQSLAVIASTYRQSHYSLWPGPVKGEGANVFTDAETCKQWDRHFKVDKAEIDQFILDLESGLIQSEEDVPESILFWPGRNNPYLVNEINDRDLPLAPFIELSAADGIYDPLQGDIPDIRGDQSIWWVMNDIGNNKEFGSVISAAIPIGLEIQVMAHAFATEGPLNDATLYRYTLLNKSSKNLKEVFSSQWTDPDLGFAGDDYVQSDVGRGLAIAFNGDGFDEGIIGYGDTPPALGIDFFSGPLADFDTIGDGIDNDNDGQIDEPGYGFLVYEGDSIDNDWDGVIDEFGERLSTSVFLYYNGNSNPSNGNPGSAQDFFSYGRGVWRDGTFMTHDFAQGLNQSFPRTTFMFPGNSWGELSQRVGAAHIPSYGEWDEFISQNQPADRRMLSSIGPYTLEPGAVKEYTIGVPWARTKFGGPRNSFDQLLCADDYIQSLFYNGDMDFQRGPDAPDVEIRELPNEVILTLNPVDFPIWRNGKPEIQNAETYREEDSDIQGEFVFEGYKIFQLIDGSISPEEYDNPDKARLIAQTDVKNGITRIVDFEQNFETGLCLFNSSIKVEGEDKGIKKTFRITEDYFNEGKTLVNNNEYFYSVVAYGFNTRANELNQLNSKQYSTYIQSQNNINVYKAIPHDKPGSTLNTAFGEGFEMTLLSGIGNGGNRIELLEGIEDSILNGTIDNLKYEKGFSPLDVRVYDPYKEDLPENLKISLTSRLVYSKSSTNTSFLPGDTIVSFGDFITSETITISPFTTEYMINPYRRQAPGLAIVLGEVTELESDDEITLEIRLLNGEEGGAFARDVIEMRSEGGEETYIGQTMRPATFGLIGNPSDLATCIDFRESDFFRIEGGGAVVSSHIPISRNLEQVFPEFGISVNIRHGDNPGYRNVERGFENNGYIDAEIVYSNDQTWLIPINYDSFPWIFSRGLDFLNYDVLDVYQEILDGSWSTWISADFNLGEFSLSPGIAVSRPEGWSRIQDLPNVDIVITQDQSKWTRCPVIQMEKPEISIAPPIIANSQKSEKPSIGKDGIEDASLAAFPEGTSTLSRGYSWFPGYAVDLDRGIRLNLVFTENSNRDSITGDDLLWNPNEDDTNNHYIIVTNLEYDFENPGSPSILQRKLDSTFLDQTVTRSNEYGRIYEQYFTWIGTMKLNEQYAELEESEREDVRVKLRVNKEYRMTENGIDPAWEFNLINSERYSRRVMSGELNMIRVVPNPYILGSQYERDFSEQLVKITHLPPKCSINIFGLDGSLIRSFDRDFDESLLGSEGATQIWDLRNESGKEINTGAYLVHISSEGVGEIIRKFFYVKRDDSVVNSF